MKDNDTINVRGSREKEMPQHHTVDAALDEGRQPGSEVQPALVAEDGARLFLSCQLAHNSDPEWIAAALERNSPTLDIPLDRFVSGVFEGGYAMEGRYTALRDAQEERGLRWVLRNLLVREHRLHIAVDIVPESAIALSPDENLWLDAGLDAQGKPLPLAVVQNITVYDQAAVASFRRAEDVERNFRSILSELSDGGAHRFRFPYSVHQVRPHKGALVISESLLDTIDRLRESGCTVRVPGTEPGPPRGVALEVSL